MRCVPSRGLVVGDTPCRKSEVAVARLVLVRTTGRRPVPGNACALWVCGTASRECVTTDTRQAHKGQRVGHDTESPYPQHKTWERARRPRARDAACARASAHDAKGGGAVDQTGLKPQQSSAQLSMCPPPTEPTRIGQHKQQRGQQQLEESACP